jgi:hypothetical protein
MWTASEILTNNIQYTYTAILQIFCLNFKYLAIYST